MAIHFYPSLQVTDSIRLWIAAFCPESNQFDDPSQLHDSARALLTEQEFARWTRFRTHTKRCQFVASRQALRHVLSKAFPNQRDARLVTSPGERPLWLQSDGHAVANLSLSHSESVITIVTGPSNILVGVDCEVIRPINAKALLASMGYAASDFASAATPVVCDRPNGHSQEFALSLWTANEAIWKAMPQADQNSLSMPFLSADSIQRAIVRNIQVNDVHFELHRFSTQVALLSSELLSPELTPWKLPAVHICVACEKPIPRQK